MNDTKNYHTLLRQYRLKIGLTQAELADRLSESQSFVSKYESGEQRIDLCELERICRHLEVSLLDFIRVYLEG